MPDTEVGLSTLAVALRRAWGPDTCAPEEVTDWRADNPARGQCITSALVVHDYLGGDLVCAEVHVEGKRVDYHWWNRLPDGRETDLTREQFAPHEIVMEGTYASRPSAPGRVADQYEVLRTRVADLLGCE